MRMIFKALVFSLLILPQIANGQKDLSIFYLSIGSEHYSLEFENYAPGFSGLINLPEARNSAVKMASLFDQMGAVTGSVMLSTQNRMIAKEELLRKVSSLIQSVKKSKAKNPFIIIYYAGHGFSAPLFEALYLPPGNFLQNPSNLTLEEWNEYAIAPLSIREMLDEHKMKYMILLDCCYSGEQKEAERADQWTIKNFGLEAVDDIMATTYGLLKAMNRMVGPNPVIFSSKAGFPVPTFPYSFPEGKLSVGPLCRRSYVVLAEKLKGHNVSLSDYMVMMLSNEVDPITKAATSYWVLEEWNLGSIRK